MHGNPPGERTSSARSTSEAGAVQTWTPPIDNEEVFRQLIAEELRNGRLTPARRRRIVRYAARLGLSSVQIGELVKACRSEALSSDDPVERHHALRVHETETPDVSLGFKIVIVLTLAALLNLIVAGCLW